MQHLVLQQEHEVDVYARQDILKIMCCNMQLKDIMKLLRMWSMREKIYSKKEICKTSSAITCDLSRNVKEHQVLFHEQNAVKSEFNMTIMLYLRGK